MPHGFSLGKIDANIQNPNTVISNSNVRDKSEVHNMGTFVERIRIKSV